MNLSLWQCLLIGGVVGVAIAELNGFLSAKMQASKSAALPPVAANPAAAPAESGPAEGTTEK